MLIYYDKLGYGIWVTDVKPNLYSNGFGYEWEAQNVENPKLFLSQYVQNIKDQCIQNWKSRYRDNIKLHDYYNHKKCCKLNILLLLLMWRSLEHVWPDFVALLIV